MKPLNSKNNSDLHEHRNSHAARKDDESKQFGNCT